MSDLCSTRIFNTFLNVKRRLESLLELCRLHEHPSWVNEDECGEFYRFCGPYRSDIEELESSIVNVTTLIENLRHELNETATGSPLPHYPLCKNQWTMEKIEELNDPQTNENTLETLAFLRLQTLAECIHQLDEDRIRPKSHLTTTNSTFQHEHTTHIVSSSAAVANGSAEKNLLEFPVEILLHIFSYLSPCELISNLAPTCQYLAQLILTRVVSHLNLSKLMTITDVPRLLQHLSYLQSITLIDWENDVSYLSWCIWFDVLARTTKNLRKIRFRNVLICPIMISLIAEYFSHSLETIIFDGQQNKTYEKFDLVLCLLGDQRNRLERVTASYQSGITNFGITQLVSNLTVLKELNLIYVEAISDETVKILCGKHHEHLEILKIDGAQLTDQALDYIARCSRLKSILIEFCNNLTGRNFSIFQNFVALEELNLSKLNEIPAESFQNLFSDGHRFERLVVLKIGECHSLDDVCIQLIMNACPNLQDFTCSWAYGVTDIGFNEIVRRCHRLEYLSLIGCYQITGDILIYVPHQYLPRIKVFNFEQCNQIADEILADLYRRKRSISITNYYGSLVEDEEDGDDDHNHDEDDET